MKCIQYWPVVKGGAMTFGDFKIILKDTKPLADFSINQLEVTKVAGKCIILAVLAVCESIDLKI